MPSPPPPPPQQNLKIPRPTPTTAPRRTPSFSSSSHSCNSSIRSSSSLSSFSSYEEFPSFSTTTPLKFKGIPFSWEQTPGIPIRQNSTKPESSRQLLPLPPAKKWHKLDEISQKKYNHNILSTTTKFDQKDPFFAALLECSKDHDHEAHFGSYNMWRKGSTSKVVRSLSGRFGFINMYGSCKSSTTCAVSESMVYHPRSSSEALINRHRSS